MTEQQLCLICGEAHPSGTACPESDRTMKDFLIENKINICKYMSRGDFNKIVRFIDPTINTHTTLKDVRKILSRAESCAEYALWVHKGILGKLAKYFKKGVKVMVEEILNWWKECVRTGTVCCTEHSYYLTKHTLSYNEAMRIYTEEKLDQEFPLAKRWED